MSESIRNPTSTPEAVLRRLEWTVIRRLDGVLHGDYRTLFRGYGLDLADLREYVYGDVWERKELSKRDRSLITVAALVALGWQEQLKTHTERALGNGVTRVELSELVTHLAMYSGWPSAMTGAHAMCDVFEDLDAKKKG